MFGLNTIIIALIVIIIGAVVYWFFIRPRGKSVSDAEQQESILKKHIIEKGPAGSDAAADATVNDVAGGECSEISQAKRTTIRSLSKLKNPVDFMIEEEEEDVFTTDDLEEGAAASAVAGLIPPSLMAFLNNVMQAEADAVADAQEFTNECLIKEIQEPEPEPESEQQPTALSPAPLVAEPESVSEPAPLVEPSPAPSSIPEPAPVAPAEEDSKKKVRIRRKK